MPKDYNTDGECTAATLNLAWNIYSCNNSEFLEDEKKIQTEFLTKQFKRNLIFAFEGLNITHSPCSDVMMTALLCFWSELRSE